MKPEEEKRDDTNSTSWPPKTPYETNQDGEGMRIWGILLFGLIGATATTFAVGQLRRTADWFYAQLTRSQASWKGAAGSSSWKEEARRRYNRRMQEEYEEEMERVERIRRMQSVFNRERNKYKKSYESWRENGPGAYHQHFQRDDWYWKTDTSYRDRRSNSRATPRESGSYSLSHHYSVLGLDRQLLERRQNSTTQIKTKIIKRLLRQSLKRC
ncbi:PREDICTED: uncharacterized protein LOC104591226 isoform X3 [Nelumbo nucifera]|uniref:Uncharacterized protein LOC104591226 isoform X3 n=1 Tax=Nelumbo nucifera TaxID=4432 RepID=A0A1U7ZAZ5_NELNU|nr:PREDICTED: uncharacterized protein LOC104591226 isoform X3 [Nelumbo nucifera]